MYDSGLSDMTKGERAPIQSARLCSFLTTLGMTHAVICLLATCPIPIHTNPRRMSLPLDRFSQLYPRWLESAILPQVKAVSFPSC